MMACDCSVRVRDAGEWMADFPTEQTNGKMESIFLYYEK